MINICGEVVRDGERLLPLRFSTRISTNISTNISMIIAMITTIWNRRYLLQWDLDALRVLGVFHSQRIKAPVP